MADLEEKLLIYKVDIYILTVKTLLLARSNKKFVSVYLPCIMLKFNTIYEKLVNFVYLLKFDQ